MDFMIKYIEALNNPVNPVWSGSDYLQTEANLTDEQLLVFQFWICSEADTKFWNRSYRKNAVVQLVGEEALMKKSKSMQTTIQKSIE